MTQSRYLEPRQQHSMQTVLSSGAWMALMIAVIVFLAQIGMPSAPVMSSVARADVPEMRGASATIDAPPPMGESAMHCCDPLLTVLCPFAPCLVLPAETAPAFFNPDSGDLAAMLNAPAIWRAIPVPRPRPKIG